MWDLFHLPIPMTAVALIVTPQYDFPAEKLSRRLRLLLDPNKHTFGREKNGIPNRPVGYELNGVGIPVRWCSTLGEQCHTKMLLI